MGINLDHATAVELTGAARAAADAFDAQMPLAGYLPARENTTLSYSFDATGNTPVDVASFRSFDTEAPYGQLGPRITKEGKLPPISRKLPVSEYTELQFINNLSALVDKLGDYAAKLGVSIAARLEIARVEAVLTGGLTLAENGITAMINYGRDASLTVPGLAAAAQWDQSTATPVDNLIAWRELVRLASKGGLPTGLMLSNRVMTALMGNPQIISYALGRSSDLPSKVSQDQVREVLRGYAGITTVTVADEVYSRYNFGRTVFPTDQIALLPPAGGLVIGGDGPLGTTDFGVPAEALQPSYGIGESERAGIFAGAFDRSDPEGLDVLVSAIALPLLQRANTTLGATVLATV
jgi:hypothetical protein